MDNLIFSLNVVLPLVLMMFLGTFLRKIKIFDEKCLFFSGANPAPEPERANWRSNPFQSFVANTATKGFSLLSGLGQSFS